MNKIVAGALGVIAGAAGGIAVSNSIAEKSQSQQMKKTEKFRTYYNVLNQWLFVKQEGKSLEDYFVKEGYHNIIIYGMGEIGNRLFKELEESSVTVKYCMDSDAPVMDCNMKTVPEDSIEGVDAVVVTAMFAFDEIEEKLEKIVDCPILSLEEVVFGV